LFPGAEKQYPALTDGLLRSSACIALIATESSGACNQLCMRMATELSAANRRVLLVSVSRLLTMSEFVPPDELTMRTLPSSTVSIWPAFEEVSSDNSAPGEFLADARWMNYLRRNFDSTVLDCPPIHSISGVADVAALADLALLVVDGARTPKEDLLRDQRTLLSEGVELSGCILTNTR
jgi:hypothetical protein